MSLFTSALEAFAKDFLRSNVDIATFRSEFQAVKDAVTSLEAKIEELENIIKKS